MSEQNRDLAAAASLGGLSAEEAERLAQEEARSPELAAQLDEYRSTVAMLDAAVARDAPPGDLFDRVLERIDAEDAGPAPAPTAPARPTRRSLGERIQRAWPAFAAGAVTAAAAAALVLALLGGDGLGSADQRAAVQGTEDFPQVHGEARLYRSARDDGVLVVELRDVPAPEPDEHYEVWVLREGGEGEMEAVGAFRPSGDSVELELPLPGPGEYEALDISVEPDGGPAEHSGRSLAGGSFEGTA